MICGKCNGSGKKCRACGSTGSADAAPAPRRTNHISQILKAGREVLADEAAGHHASLKGSMHRRFEKVLEAIRDGVDPALIEYAMAAHGQRPPEGDDQAYARKVVLFIQQNPKILAEIVDRVENGWRP